MAFPGDLPFVSTGLAWFCTILSERHEINDCYDLLRWQSLLRRPDSALLGEGSLEIWICDFRPFHSVFMGFARRNSWWFSPVHVSKMIFPCFCVVRVFSLFQSCCWPEMTAFFDNDKNPFAIFFSLVHALCCHSLNLLPRLSNWITRVEIGPKMVSCSTSKTVHPFLVWLNG